MNAQAFRYLKGAFTTLVLVSLTIIVLLTLKLHKEKVKETAKSFFTEIVTTRAWNSGHGGVYVFVDENTQPNPYLDTPLRDLYTTDSQMLTLINPAYMTRQISELAERDNYFLYHITSNKPIRPLNAPDPWEENALKTFSKESDFIFEKLISTIRNITGIWPP